MAGTLIVALDVDTRAEAEAIVQTLGDTVDFYKIGYQLFYGGDGLALMSGPQCNLLQKRGGGEPVCAEGFATQLWVKEEAGWRIASFHGTRVLA